MQLDPPSTPSYLLQLPDELQLMILGQLPLQDLLKATVICRKWHQLIYGGSLWTSINTSLLYKSIPIELIIRLIKSSARFLKKANFRGCIQLTGHGLRTLALSCPNLEVLNIRDCRGLSFASIDYFLQHAANLKVLDVSGLDAVKSSTFANATCSKLERLDASWCRNITGNGILPLVKQPSATLTYLKINGCPQLDQETMTSLGTNLPNLRHFSLADCTNLTDAAFISFLESSSPGNKITHLNLSGCSRLSDAVLLNLAVYTQHIQHLELAGCVLMTDQGLCHLFARVQTFVHLDLEDILHITTSSIRSIANHQPHLQRLCLSGCTHVSDDDIGYLISGCHQLQHLELDNCMITDKALHSIVDHLQQHEKNQATPLSRPQPAKRKLSVEVLDCSNLTELGIKAASEASSLLAIKSFYSFQRDDVEVNHNANHNTMHSVHRPRGLGISGHYSALGGQRRIRADDNCIIS